MYQFQTSSHMDVLMPLDLSAVFFVLIDQHITDQKGVFQGVIPACTVSNGLAHIETHLSFLPHYHDFLSTDIGREYAKIQLSYLNHDKLQQMIPENLKPFLQQVDIYNQVLRRDYSNFYKFSSPELLLLSAELKKRLLIIIEMLKRADTDHESIMFQKL
jgi:hypothetical protein